jgi:cytosine/adenosine deaminase-related metal-dependent hydrolase
MAVRFGMSREGAIRALTIAGAKMLELDKRVGSLEAGKDADFIILSGDPFSVYTHVEQTFVEGVKVFDRSDAEDRLFATGGFGAGEDQEPYLCCAPQTDAGFGQ